MEERSENKDLNKKSETLDLSILDELRGEGAEEQKDSSAKDIVRGAIIGLIIMVLVAIFIKPIIVQGSSMEPTINNKDYLLISRQAYKIGEPERGDIVVFPHQQGSEDTLYIKRVIALPGDHLKIKNGKVYINNKLQDEEYLKDGTKTSGNIDYTIPEGEIFVMGDNRENSSDSRFFGTVSIEDVKGKVLIRLFPFNKIGKV